MANRELETENEERGLWNEEWETETEEWGI